jgi:hypothetical protein
VYGQRYDNGQRHDGLRAQKLKLPSGELTKGPETMWDAPGMVRIKIPFGGVNPEQMEVLADLSEEYADGVSHVTTRQDIQYHFVHIDDTPTLMRRLAAVGITTREACGNVVRNVTACPIAGVCKGEGFDVTPYAKACSKFLLGHPDTQAVLGRYPIRRSCLTNSSRKRSSYPWHRPLCESLRGWEKAKSSACAGQVSYRQGGNRGVPQARVGGAQNSHNRSAMD